MRREAAVALASECNPLTGVEVASLLHAASFLEQSGRYDGVTVVGVAVAVQEDVEREHEKKHSLAKEDRLALVQAAWCDVKDLKHPLANTLVASHETHGSVDSWANAVEAGARRDMHGLGGCCSYGGGFASGSSMETVEVVLGSHACNAARSTVPLWREARGHLHVLVVSGEAQESVYKRDLHNDKVAAPEEWVVHTVTDLPSLVPTVEILDDVWAFIAQYGCDPSDVGPLESMFIERNILNPSVSRYLCSRLGKLFPTDLYPDRSTLSKAIIGMGGSFNPIHQGHIASVIQAVRAVLSTGRYILLSVELAAAMPSWVSAKLEDTECMKPEHRLETLNIAIDHARREYSAFANLFRHQRICHPHIRSSSLELCDLATVSVINIVGTDRALMPKTSIPRWRRKLGFVNVLILRMPVEDMERLWKEDRANGLVSDPDEWILVHDLGYRHDHSDASSTAVRRVIKEHRNQQDGLAVALSGLVCQGVAEYISNNLSDLFVCNT